MRFRYLLKKRVQMANSSSSSDQMEIVLDPEGIDAMDTSTVEEDDAKEKNGNEGEMENAKTAKGVSVAGEDTTGAKEQKDVDAAASDGATSGLDNASPGTGDASVSPRLVRVNARRSMDVDDETSDASVLSSPDYMKRINNEQANTSRTESRANVLMNQTIMDIVKDELQKLIKSNCAGPPEDEPGHQVTPPTLVSRPPPQVSQPPLIAFQPPLLASQSPPLMFHPPPLMYQSSPQVTQPPPLALTDFSVRSGPSRGEPYDLDYLLAHRPPPSPGRHPLGDLAIASELAMQTMHGRTWFRDYNSSTRREPLRPARFTPYDRAYHDERGTRPLRRSRIVQSGPRDYESLVYPALYATKQHAARERDPHQTNRQLLNPSISILNPSQTSTPRFTSQYNPQSPTMVFKQASNPTELITSSLTGPKCSSGQPGSMSSSSQPGSMSGSRQHGSMSGSRQHGSMSGSRQHGSMSGSRQHGSMSGSRQHGSMSGSRQPGSMSSSKQPGLMSSCQPGVKTSSPTKLITSCPTMLITSSPTTLIHSSPPRLVPISAPRSSPISCSQSSSSASTDFFNLPYVSDEPQQSLDFSLLPRQLPPLIPILQAQIACPSETHTVARPRFAPRTHTVTSTKNTLVSYPHDRITRTEEPYKTTKRIEIYKNCSEHLLNRPATRHRARTPTDNLPEHLLYQTWPVDNLNDHMEEVETTEVDSWFDEIEAADIAEAVAASLQSVQLTPVTRPPPMIVPPLSRDSTRATSLPRTTSS